MIRTLFSVLAVFLLFTSCKQTLFPALSRNSPELDLEELNFEYLTIKSKIDFQQTHGSQEVTSIFRIRKDSVIWFNLSGALGVQGMRGILTKDSAKILNRVDKEYWIYDYQELSNQFNFSIDYDLIQAMILGNMPKKKRDQDLTKMQNGNFLIRQEFGSFIIDNKVDGESNKLVEVNVREKDTDNSLTLLYKNFMQVETQSLPFSSFVSLVHTNEFGSLETRLNIEHSKVESSLKPLRFPFSIPSKYARK